MAWGAFHMHILSAWLPQMSQSFGIILGGGDVGDDGIVQRANEQHLPLARV